MFQALEKTRDVHEALAFITARGSMTALNSILCTVWLEQKYPGHVVQLFQQLNDTNTYKYLASWFTSDAPTELSEAARRYNDGYHIIHQEDYSFGRLELQCVLTAARYDTLSALIKPIDGDDVGAALALAEELDEMLDTMFYLPRLQQWCLLHDYNIEPTSFMMEDE